MNIRQDIGPDTQDRQRHLEAVLSQNGFSRREAAAMLDETFRILTDTMPQLVWRSHDLGKWTWASRQWTAFTGQSSPDSEGLGWLECVHPDDREMTMEAWRAAASKGSLETLHRIMAEPGGEYRWFETRALPLVGDDGITEWFGTCTDVHDLHVAMERERLLHAELQNRVRGILASLRDMIRRTQNTPGSREDFTGHFEGRLGCLSRLQSQATRDPFGRVSLSGLVAGEMFAVLSQEGRGLLIEGPEVTVSLRAAQPLTLALHEMAINSVKFGTLDRPSPGLAVRWALSDEDGDRTLTITWSEDAPGTAPPRSEGFGMDVLRRQLPRELGGKVDLDFRPEGLVCTMRFPLGRPVGDPAFEIRMAVGAAPAP